MVRKISIQEVAKHKQEDDVWIVVDDNVYDMTAFAPEHPGGSEIIYRFAGKDASAEYNAIHAPGLIVASLPEDRQIGALDTSTVTEEWLRASYPTQTAGQLMSDKPPLSTMLNLRDFEAAAKQTFTPQAWSFISSGADDSLTRDLNSSLLQRILLRPHILRDVSEVSTATSIFGTTFAAPFYICPTGAARTAGTDGEIALARAAAAKKIPYCVSTPASFPHTEVRAAVGVPASGATGEGPRIWHQLYVHRNRAVSEAAVREAEASGKVGAIFVTVDLPVVSKREDDERAANMVWDASEGKWVTRIVKKRIAGLAKGSNRIIDPALSWDDLTWLRGVTKLPIVLKGIQRADDARKALALGVQGVVLSNHGGRAVDTAPPAILTLLELHRNCPEVFGRMEIFVDGGFRRGSEIIKALCLGASAVGLGRGFLYSVNYGQEGVEHAIDLVRDEMETTMRLCGMVDLMRDAHPDLVNTGDIDHLVFGASHPYARKPAMASKL